MVYQGFFTACNLSKFSCIFARIFYYIMNVLKNPDFYRPKTYMMLLAVLCTFCSVIFSFVKIDSVSYSLTRLLNLESKIITELTKNEIWRIQIAFTFAVITGMTTLYGVTMPNERSKQMKFCLFGTFPAAFQFLLMYQFVEGIKGELVYFGIMFPILAILFLFIARIFLRLDEAKIKKMNRLWD